MSEIRSVSVHLDANVSSYIAKMRLAGAETDKAFGRTQGIEQTNSKLQTTESTLGGVDRAATKAETSVRRLEGTMSRSGSNGNGFSRATSKLDSFVGKLGLVPTLAITTTSALIPLAAAGAGVAAAFAAPLVFTGGALTLFGFLGGAAIKETLKQYKAVDALEKKLSGLKKGTAEYVQVQKQLHDANAAISPQQQRFHTALETLEGDFQKFIAGPAGNDLLAPFTQGLKVADDLLPHATPLIKVVSSDLGQLLGELDHYAQSPSFSRLIRGIAHQVGPDLLTFGHIVGDVGPGIGHLLLILGRRLSPGLLHDLSDLTGEFAHWASSKQARHDVQDFVDYLHRVGPGAADAVGSLARGTAHLVHALAPLGPPTLHVIKGIADALSGIPTPVLTALLGAGAGLVATQKLGGLKAAPYGARVLGKVGQYFGYGSGPGGGAGGLGGGIIGKGVVPVYVTNWGGKGGMPTPGEPGAGGWKGALTGAGVLAEDGGLTAAAGAAGLALAGIAFTAYIGYMQRNLYPYGKGAGAVDPGVARGGVAAARHFGTYQTPTPTPGIPTQNGPYAARGGQAAVAYYQAQAHGVTAVGTAVEALHKRLATASRDMDLVGHSADRAFGGGERDVQRFGSRLDSIKGGHASAQLDLIRHSADQSTAKAGADVDHLQSKVNSLHGPKPINIKADTAAAEAALRRVYADLAVIRSKTITVTTAHVTGGRTTAGNAAGGYISGPGGPTSDDIPAWLSNGEYVVKASAVRHYGLGMMHAVNANRYASGGPVATHTSNTSSGQYAGMSAEARGVAVELHHLRGSLAATRHELDLERQQRQAIAQQRAQLVSTVRDNFRSPLFGDGSTGIWGAATDPLSILRTDISNARAYRTDVGRLRRRGLRGGALAQVTTLADAQQAMGLSRAEDREISRLYQVRQRASQAAGAASGNARYGAELAAIGQEIRGTNRRVDNLTREVKHQTQQQAKHPAATGHAVGNAVNGAARTARRRGRPPT